MNQSIDVIKLYTLGSQKGWNEFLTKCYNNLDINSLARVMRELQVGMSDASTKKLTDAKIELFYIRLIRSLEITAKRIIKVKHPMPTDNPFLAKKYKSSNEAKKARDQELQQFLKSRSY